MSDEFDPVVSKTDNDFTPVVTLHGSPLVNALVGLSISKHGIVSILYYIAKRHLV